VTPHGTEAPGCPVMLNGKVKGIQSYGSTGVPAISVGLSSPTLKGAQAIRQRQHPLAHRHPRQHRVDERGRVLRHPPPPPARTEASALAREGHETLERTLGTPQPREALGQHPAAEEVAELVLDEARQAAPVAAGRDFPQEGLQVLTNDGVEHGVLGVTGPIRGVGMRHALA